MAEQLNGEPESWPEPNLSLLHETRTPAPAFPLEVLPERWRQWVVKEAAGCNAPVDFVAMTLFAAAGALLGNARWVETTRALRSPPSLWTCLVGKPGSGKSQAQKAVLAILASLSEEMAGDFEGTMAEYRQKVETSKLEHSAWQQDYRDARKKGDPLPPRPSDAVEPEKPVRPRIYVGDITPEELHVLASGNPRGLTKIHDELAGWFGSFNRYADGGDREMYLERYDGAPHDVDRKSADPLHVPRHTVGILGGTQPDKLDGCLGSADDGMAGRFCWVFPDLIPVADPQDHEPDPWATAALRKLLRLPMATDENGKPVPVYVRFADDARKELFEVMREAKTAAREKHGYLATAMERAPGIVARLSLIFEYLHFSANAQEHEPEVLSVLSVLSARTMLKKYLSPMSERVFGNYALPPDERLAAHLLAYIRKHKVQTFNAREITRGGEGWRIPGVTDRNHLMSALALLVDDGIVREAGKSGQKGGRPRSDYEVNPAVLTEQFPSDKMTKPPKPHQGTANGSFGSIVMADPALDALPDADLAPPDWVSDVPGLPQRYDA